MEAEKKDVRRSRRAVLAAAAGAAAASVAAAIERPGTVLAGVDGDVVLGAENVATSTTEIVVIEPGDVAFNARSSRIGVEGFSDSGAGVAGRTESGTGVDAFAPIDNPSASALVVRGRVRFSRSGRATVLAGKSRVDVDLRPDDIPASGLEGTPLCFATMMSYRFGVFVTTMRPNYPVPGKARIYLNKAVASNAFVSWVVFDKF